MEITERKKIRTTAFNFPFTNIQVFPYSLKNLDTTEAIIFAVMVDKLRKDVNDENKNILEDWFEFTTNYVAEITFLDTHLISVNINKLKKKNLLEIKKVGEKRFIKPNLIKIDEYLTGEADVTKK